MKALVQYLILPALLILPMSISASDWARFQGPAGNGVSPETALNFEWGEEGPPQAWAVTLDEGFGGAAVHGNEVFVVDRKLGETDVLLCLDLNDGSEKWRYEFTHPGRLPHHGSRGTPWVEEDAVYFTSGFSHVHRINRETHQPDWMVNVAEKYGAESPKWGWAQSPLIVGDILVTAAMSPTAGLAGLDKNTGEEVWVTEPFGDSHSSPVLLELQGQKQVTFIATNQADEEGTTISVDPATGEVFWKTNVYFNKIPIPFPIKIDEETVYLTGGYENGSCMIKVTNTDASWQVKKLWDHPTRGTQMHPPMVVGEHIYFLANENANHKGEARETGGLMCMDFEGNVLWHTGNDPFMGRGNMIMADGKLLIQDGETGYLRVVNSSPEGYEQIAEADIFGKRAEVEEMLEKQEGRATIRVPDFKYWSAMALSDGRLILRGQTQLVCVDLRTGSDT